MSLFVELSLYTRHPNTGLSAEIRVRGLGIHATLALDVPVSVNPVTFLEYANDPQAYGRELSSQLFAHQDLRDAWLKIRAQANTTILQFRLRLDVRAHDLHSLRWELLTDPETGVYLALDERIRFVRTLDSANLTPMIGALRDELRALIVVSNPTNLGQFHLAEVDVDGELSRARKALGTIPTTVLGDDPDAAGRATLVNLAAQLRSAPQVVFLIAHGTVVGGVPYLWLEDETGAADKVPGSTLVAMLSRLVRRPLLFTLLSCRSAGNGYGETLSALGPQLSAIGFPAVIAFQGDVAMSTVKGILPPLITELQRDGQIDRALAAARGALGLTQPWWQAVLWIQSEGALWQEQSNTDDPSNGDTLLEAIIQPHHDVIGSKITRFVGRESELIHIEKQIATLQPEGGYLLVQGHAGEGKSSILAMVILRDLIARSQVSVPQEWNNQTFRQFALSVGRDKLFYHFIPSDPGREHQISLLRDINAQLALRYGLPSFYADNTSLPALKNFFVALLNELHARRHRIVIIIDGLDQLPPESDGRRDISFLPSLVPSGIVLVIGTRPDDTFVELSQKPQSTVYEIPHLSRSDFEFILKQKKLELDSSLIQRLYVTLQQNALYLDLAVRELIAQPALEAEDLLHRVADNPDNLFSFTIDRLSLGSNQARWERVTQPILGLLLVASAPLSELALRELLQVAPRELRQSLQQLGGLLSQTSDARFSLFHRKFHDYLREDADNPAKDFVFTSTDEHRYHLRLIDWCANGAQGLQPIWNQAPADALEQERRTFARQYYVPHLAAAGNYAQLWKLIDDDEYGRAKRRYDRSLRAYLRDLDVARRSFQDAHKGNAEAQALALPHIWRYNVVYRLMNSYSPHYSSTYLCALSAVGSIAEALSLANRVTEPSAKLRVLCAMSRTVLGVNDNDARIIALEAYQSIDTLGTEPADIEAAMLLAQVLFDCHSDNESEQIIHYVTTSLSTLTGRSVRVQVSLTFAQLLYHTGRMEESERLHEEIGRLAHADNNDAERSALINSLVVCRNIAYAIDVWKQIRSTQHRIQASKAISRYCQLIGDTATLALVMSELQILAAQSADLDLAVALHLAGDMLGAERIFAAKQTRIDERWSWGRRDLGSNISDDNFEYWYGDDPHFTEPRDREVDSLLIDYIPALIETAQWDRAYTHTKRMTDDTKLNQVLRSLATALIDAGQWGFARRIIAAIASQNERTALLATLAIAFAHTQQWQEAQRTIAELPNDDVRLSPGCTLIIALARAGQLSEAVQLSTHYRNKAQGLVLQSYLPKAIRTFEVLARSLDGDRVDEIKTILMTAKRSAEMIADPLQRATVLLRLGTMFFEIQETGTAQTCFADSADTSRSLNDPVARATLLRSLAKAVAEAQLDHTDTIFLSAKEAAEALSDNAVRIQELLQLGEAMAAGNRREQALQVFDSVKHNIHRITPDREQLKPLFSLANAHFAVGDGHTAKVILNDYLLIAKFVSAERRDGPLLTLFETALRHAYWDIAHATAESLYDKEEYIRTIRTLAMLHAQSGRWAEVHQIIEAAEPHHAPMASYAAAVAFATFRQWKEAYQIVERVTDHQAQHQLMQALKRVQAQALAQSGDWVDAQIIIATLSDRSEHDQALRDVITAFIRAGSMQEARALVDSISDAELQVLVFQDVAEACIRERQFDLAQTIIDAIPFYWRRPYVQDLARQKLALALASECRFKEAQIVVESISMKSAYSSSCKDAALAGLALQLAENNYGESALTNIASIGSPHTRIDVLKQLVICFARIGRDEFMHKAMRLLLNEHLEPRQLQELCSAFAQQGLMPASVALLHHQWFHISSADVLLESFVLDQVLIQHYPMLAQTFLSSFDWIQRVLIDT